MQKFPVAKENIVKFCVPFILEVQRLRRH